MRLPRFENCHDFGGSDRVELLEKKFALCGLTSPFFME
jgi:hypothetical protein